MNFPEWAPRILIDHYRHPDINRDDKAILERLLTNPEMEDVWTAFRDKFKGFNGPPYVSFWSEVCRAYRDATGDLPARSEQTSDRQEVEQLARRLAKVLRRTGLDMPLGAHLAQYFSHLGLSGRIAGDLEQGVAYLMPTSQFIDSLGAYVGEFQHKAIVSPGADGAPMNYFVRKMARHFKKWFGSNCPSLLVRLTATVFEGEPVDINRISNALRTSPLR